MRKWICIKDLQQMAELLDVCEIIVCILAVLVPSMAILLGDILSMSVNMLLYLLLGECLAVACVLSAILRDSGGLKLFGFLHLLSLGTSLTFLL